MEKNQGHARDRGSVGLRGIQSPPPRPPEEWGTQRDHSEMARLAFDGGLSHIDWCGAPGRPHGAAVV